MSIELILLILIVLVVITTIARVAQVGRRAGGLGTLRRRLNESPAMWAVRAVTGRRSAEPVVPEMVPGEVNPLDRLAALMGDGGPGEEPHERYEPTREERRFEPLQERFLPPAAASPYVPPRAPAPYVPPPASAPYLPAPLTPYVPPPAPVPMAAAKPIQEEYVPPLLQQRAPRPLAAASPMVVAANPTASMNASDIGTRSTGWLAEIMASQAALADPVSVPVISRRRRIYRDASIVLLVCSIIALVGFAVVPGLTNPSIAAVATPTPEASQIAVVPTATPSPTPSTSIVVTPSPTPSPTPTESPSPSPSATPTLAPTPTPRVTPRPTPQPTPQPTPKPTPKPTPPPPPPFASWSSNNGVCVGSQVRVTFTNHSIGATHFKWSFGDGGTATFTSGTHLYAGTGNYLVTLTAYNAANKTSKDTHYVFTSSC